MIVGLCLLIIALIVIGLSMKNEGFEGLSDDTALYTKMHEQLQQIEVLWRAKQQRNLQVLTSMCTTEDVVKNKLRDTLTAGYAAERGATTITDTDIERANKEIKQTSLSKQIFDCFKWKSNHVAKVLNEGYASCGQDNLTVSKTRGMQWTKLFNDVIELEKNINGRPDISPILTTEAWLQSVIQPSINRMKENQQREGFINEIDKDTMCVRREDIVGAEKTLANLRAILTDAETKDDPIIQSWTIQHTKTTNMIDTLNNYANTTTSTHTVD